MVNDITYIVVFLGILIFLAIFLGNYMAKVFTGKRTILSFIIRPLEISLYKLCGIDETRMMSWKQYSLAFILFNITGLIAALPAPDPSRPVAAQSDGLRACPLGHGLEYEPYPL